jgi:hypothetical protein
MAVLSKPLTAFANVVPFLSKLGRHFFEICDCNIRVVVCDVCCPWMMVCLDGLEHGSVQWRTQEFFSGGRVAGGSTKSVEDRENGDLGAAPP